ncbi:hypothetical protein J6590_065586 [Homalodisca vitripennis]|nr:hypothetical protein J6590_065586 [Homalodisca vitripennis]
MDVNYSFTEASDMDVDCSVTEASNTDVDCSVTETSNMDVDYSVTEASDMDVDCSVTEASNTDVDCSVTETSNMDVDYSVTEASGMDVDYSVTEASDMDVDCSVTEASNTDVDCSVTETSNMDVDYSVTEASGMDVAYSFTEGSSMDMDCSVAEVLNMDVDCSVTEVSGLFRLRASTKDPSLPIQNSDHAMLARFAALCAVFCQVLHTRSNLESRDKYHQKPTVVGILSQLDVCAWRTGFINFYSTTWTTNLYWVVGKKRCGYRPQARIDICSYLVVSSRLVPQKSSAELRYFLKTPRAAWVQNVLTAAPWPLGDVNHVKSGKKRKLNVQSWNSKVRKDAKDHGEPYISKNKKPVPGKLPPGEARVCSCQFQCGELTHDEKKKLLVEFYKLDYNKQTPFLANACTKVVNIARRRICLYQHLVQNGTFKLIDHKFPEVGHTYLDSDRDFGIIEKNLRKHETIFTPEEYRNVIAKSNKKNLVIDVTLVPCISTWIS